MAQMFIACGIVRHALREHSVENEQLCHGGCICKDALTFMLSCETPTSAEEYRINCRTRLMRLDKRANQNCA